MELELDEDYRSLLCDKTASFLLHHVQILAILTAMAFGLSCLTTRRFCLRAVGFVVVVVECLCCYLCMLLCWFCLQRVLCCLHVVVGMLLSVVDEPGE